MKMDKETEKKVAELQILEQSIQNLLLQKQNFQAQVLETENALNELKKTKEKPYKIVGTVMVITNKEDLEKELNSKKDILNLKIKNMEKQEAQIKEKATKLQQEIVKTMSGGKK